MIVAGIVASVVVLVLVVIQLNRVMSNRKRILLIIILNLLLLVMFTISARCYQDMSQYAGNGGEPFGIIFIPLVSVPLLIVLWLLKMRFSIGIIFGMIRG